MLAQQRLLGHRHGGGDGENEAAQAAGHLAHVLQAPLVRGIDLAKGLRKQLHHHEHEQAALGKHRPPGRRAPGRHGVQGRAGLMHVLHPLAPHRRRTDIGLGGVEMPILLGRLDVPQIALGGRQAGQPLVADGRGGQADRLRPDAQRAEPLQRHLAVAAAADHLAAECTARELDPGLERVAPSHLGPFEVAELQGIRVVEVALDRAAVVVLDQHATGAAVADVEDEVDVDRLVGQVARNDVDQAQARHAGCLRQQAQEGQIQRLMLHRLQRGAVFLRVAQHLHQPLIDPFLGDEPRHGVEQRAQHEVLAPLPALQAALLGRGERGVERQHGTQRLREVGLLTERIQLQPRPIPGFALVARGQVHRRGVETKVGQRYPVARERAQRRLRVRAQHAPALAALGLVWGSRHELHGRLAAHLRQIGPIAQQVGLLRRVDRPR